MTPLRIALVGATGQLGADLVRALEGDQLEGNHRVEALGHDAIEVTDRASVDAAIARVSPDWLVTTAAYHDVDRCDGEPGLAMAVNALGTAHLAAAAAERAARLLYVSTDYVFSGGKSTPYVESDAAEPVNVYGASKLAGEAVARALNPERTLVVRTSGLYGSHPCRGKKGGLNFVDLMLKLGRERGKVRVVDDETLAPTYTSHLATAMRAAMEAGASGTLHAAASGHCSWWEFARAIFEETGMAVAVERAAPGEFAKKAARPRFSALASERLQALGLAPLPPWREGLRAYLDALGLRASA